MVDMDKKMTSSNGLKSAVSKCGLKISKSRYIVWLDTPSNNPAINSFIKMPICVLCCYID